MALKEALKYNENLELPEVNSRGSWYLTYSKKPGDFEGKIVLVGPMASGLQDSYIAAIDHAKERYGVEYQADAALTDPFIKSYCWEN